MKDELFDAIDAAEKAEIDLLRSRADAEKQEEIEDRDPRNINALKRRFKRCIGVLPWNLGIEENARLSDKMRSCLDAIDAESDPEAVAEFVGDVEKRTKTMIDKLRHARLALSN